MFYVPMIGGGGGRCALVTEATADFDKAVASGVPQIALATATTKGTPMGVVELSVKCKNLRDRDITSRSDPMCIFYLSEGANKGPWKFVGRSQRVMNTLNPEFLTKFQVNYFFEQVQYVKFEIYDVDNEFARYSRHDFLGGCVMTLGEIVGAFGSTVHKMLTMDEQWPFKNHGSIIVTAHEVAEKSQPVLIKFCAKSLDRKDFLGKSDPFFQFYRVNDDTSRTLLHRSEVVEHELNPVWKPFKVQMNQIADNEKRILEVLCLDHDENGRHDTIGSFQTTYERLSSGPGQENIYDVINGKKTGKKGYKNSGTFELTRITNIFPAPTFLDYIRGGTQIHFTVAIDFSCPRDSKEAVTNPHRLGPLDNEYYMALKAVGEIVQDYDSDKLFPALGCGAKIPPNMHESDDFSLNFQADPQCHGVDGLLEAYQNAANIVRPVLTARFSKIITQMSKIAQAAAISKTGTDYFILLMLTSGAVIDIRQTIAAIIDASSLPLSIIIVGVGDNDFKTMERLDADQKRLTLNDKKAERDIVQFIEFNKIKKKNVQNAEAAQAKLAREVLREVPRQLASWMNKNSISPRSPIQVDGERLPVGLPSAEPSSGSGAAEPIDYRTQESHRSLAHPSSVRDAPPANYDYRTPDAHRSEHHPSSARGAAPRNPDYRSHEGRSSPAHPSSAREPRSYHAIRPSAPPEEMSHHNHKPNMMHNGPPSMMHYNAPAAPAHYGTPPLSRAADYYANQPYESATPYRHRSHSARDNRYHNDPKDPYAGHYY